MLMVNASRSGSSDATSPDPSLSQQPQASATPGTYTDSTIVETSDQDHHQDQEKSSSLPLTEPYTRPNIIIFGETGTGKSALINMIAGKDIAHISNGALGCTFATASHPVTIDKKPFTLWDTAGLNEGEHGVVSAEQAVKNLEALVNQLKDGVSLLVYCIRANRFRDILKVNYDIFYTAICQEKVPIVIVVTGLENQDPMESWWEENKLELERRGMNFVGHACVTATRGKQIKSGGYAFQEEYNLSEVVVRKLIEDSISAESAVDTLSDMRTIGGIISQHVAGYSQGRVGVSKSSTSGHCGTWEQSGPRNNSEMGGALQNGIILLLRMIARGLVRLCAVPDAGNADHM